MEPANRLARVLCAILWAGIITAEEASFLSFRPQTPPPRRSDSHARTAWPFRRCGNRLVAQAPATELLARCAVTATCVPFLQSDQLLHHRSHGDFESHAPRKIATRQPHLFLSATGGSQELAVAANPATRRIAVGGTLQLGTGWPSGDDSILFHGAADLGHNLWPIPCRQSLRLATRKTSSTVVVPFMALRSPSS